MVRKIVQKLRIKQIRTLAKNKGIVQIGENVWKIRWIQNGGFDKKCGGICTWWILDFRMGDFEYPPILVNIRNPESPRLNIPQLDFPPLRVFSCKKVNAVSDWSQGVLFILSKKHVFGLRIAWRL